MGSGSDPPLCLVETADGFKETGIDPKKFFSNMIPRGRPRKRTLSQTKDYWRTLPIPEPEPEPDNCWGGEGRRADVSPARSYSDMSRISINSSPYSYLCPQEAPFKTIFVKRSKSHRSHSCPPFKPLSRSRFLTYHTWFGTRARRGRSCSYSSVSSVSSNSSERSPTPILHLGDNGHFSDGYSRPSPGWESSEEEPIYGTCSLGFEYRKNKRPLSASERRA
jgi:hypothetical protein